MGKILKALETYQDSDEVKVEILLPYFFCSDLSFVGFVQHTRVGQNGIRWFLNIMRIESIESSQYIVCLFGQSMWCEPNQYVISFALVALTLRSPAWKQLQLIVNRIPS